MTKAEIFENLVLPLKRSLTDEEWKFLLSRGEMFIKQTSTDNDFKPPIGASFIKAKVERCLHQGGYKPYSLLTHPHKVSGAERSFSTLKELKDFFGITKIEKKGKGWAINSRGNKIEWDEYEVEIPIEYVLY